MHNKEFIPTRLVNMAIVMPNLSLDLSVPLVMVEIFFAMIPAKLSKNDFDFLVIAYRSLSEGYCAFPIGILSLIQHPLFIDKIAVERNRKPSVWCGGARFLDYKMAVTYLEPVDWLPKSMKRLRNVNTVAGAVFETYGRDRYFGDTEYAGHKLLTWR